MKNEPNPSPEQVLNFFQRADVELRTVIEKYQPEAAKIARDEMAGIESAGGVREGDLRTFLEVGYSTINAEAIAHAIMTIFRDAGEREGDDSRKEWLLGAAAEMEGALARLGTL